MTDIRINRLNDQGVQRHLEGGVAAAEALYHEALALAPEHATTLNNLGFLCAQMERWDQAREYLQRALAIEPGQAMAHSNLGQVLVHQGDLQTGMSHLQTATRLDPESALAWQNFGRMQLVSGDPRGAESSLTRALTIAGPSATLLTRLGTSLALQQRYVDAAILLRQATDLEPDNADAWAQLGGVLFIDRDFGSARRALSRALELIDCYRTLMSTATVLPAAWHGVPTACC